MSYDNFQGDEYNIAEIVKGTDFSLSVGFDEDITGCGFSAEMLSADWNTILKTFTVAIDTVNRRVILSLSIEDVADLTKGLLRWRFFVTDAIGKKRRWLYGTAQVKA